MILIKEELNHLHAEHAYHAEHLDHAGKQSIWGCYKFLSKTAKVIEIKSEISSKLISRLNYDDFWDSQKWFAKVSKLVPCLFSPSCYKTFQTSLVGLTD